MHTHIQKHWVKTQQVTEKAPWRALPTEWAKKRTEYQDLKTRERYYSKDGDNDKEINKENK